MRLTSARSRASQPAGEPAALDSPAANRLQPRRWLDPRILLGLVLVIASVVVGARVIGAADDTITVWAASTDLAGGSTIRDGDVEQVQVRIDDNAAAYVGAGDDPVGLRLDRDVAAGELLPVAALADDDAMVSMALSVPTDSVPATIKRGQRISVYATAGDEDPAAAVLVAAGVTVDDVVTAGSGALSVSINTVQIVIRVPECAVQNILAATVDRELTVVLVDGPTSDELTC